MKNSFYIKTQAASNVQGPNYFRNLNNISLGMTNNVLDSYFVEDDLKEDGGESGTIVKTGIRTGGVFLDKRAVYNQYIPDGNVPWGEQKPYFKFGITPKWGYTNPRVVSHEENGTVYSTNESIELTKKNMEADSTISPTPDLELGKWSWFHQEGEKEDNSLFQYMIYMPVDRLKAVHPMRAIDIETDKITVNVTNDTNYLDGDPNNTILSHDDSAVGTTFDLVNRDQIKFNPNFKMPQSLIPEDSNFIGFKARIITKDNPMLDENYVLEIGKDTENKDYFKPDDIISISDFFRRDSKILLDKWNNSIDHTLNDTDKQRLYLIMYSSEINIEMIPMYAKKESSEGKAVTGYVNKYLQDVTKSTLEYKTTFADQKSMSVPLGANIFFNKFAKTYVNPADKYTYYLNEKETTSKGQVTSDGEELAHVNYDRGLNVKYQDTGTEFNGKPITDPNVYKTYADNNQATIQFPSVEQSPTGKIFDYWTVDELNEDGHWVSKPGAQIKQAQTGAPVTYIFSSGTKGNNKSIRLTAVWKDISPDSYISIPKNILLTEQGTNLTPESKYAGTKVTIGYKPVNTNNKDINVDVLKTFNLSKIDDPAKEIEVSSYDAAGQLLSAPTDNNKYARIGTFGSTGLQSIDIWFNTPTLDDNSTYSGKFDITSESSQLSGGKALFYISPAMS